jgi:prepilin-type N-terminal cleavage/methylation domain-containing protein
MRRLSRQSGFTLLELMLVVSLAAIFAAWAIPQTLLTLDDLRTFGAARYMSTRLYRTRMEAVSRTADAAMRFTMAGGSYGYAVYLDGNHNGVRSRDIQRGLDRVIQPRERLTDQFPGVDFGTLPNLPPVDGSSTPGMQPVRFGSGDTVTFTALGTSTTGSLYIRGRRTAQYVIRVFGQTGKIRILKFDSRLRAWRAL